WDESSSISSGLSDGSDNLSSEEFITSPTLNSLPTTPIGSRRNSAITVKTDGKPTDKSRLAVKNCSLQRSSSDAGKDQRNGTGSCEQRKPPSGLAKPSTGGNFGFKKPTQNNTSSPAVSAGGNIPKTSGIPVKPAAGGCKTSLDVSNSDPSGFLSPNARTSLQYRSLPRPAKTSTLTLTRPSSARPVSSTVDVGSGISKFSGTALQGPRLKEQPGLTPGTVGLSKTGGRGIPSPVNQTDREKEKERAKAKAVVSDSECGGGPLKGSRAQTAAENGGRLQGLRAPSSKCKDLPSSNTHLTKPPSVSHMDKMNSSNLEVIEAQDSLPPKIPPYSKLQELASSASPCLTPSPAPLLNVNSSACFSSSQRDRNTLPKKGVSASQVEFDGKEKGERRHSHTILPRMTRSNSIPTQDTSTELYGASPLGSTLSLAERPRSLAMVRSGSFRDKELNDEHGSVISLASNASSSYSSQIRKLRRELESSQEKVSNLTTQLSANANLVAAFEQSLALMTTRLQSLSLSHDQKDTELMELRETIEALKAKNDEAQAVIHGALNHPDNDKLRIRRQNSCESISSLNSLTSMSSVGSLKDQDAKKKKKKSWLRSSFNKAFSIKKGPKTCSDIEEIVTPDSSAPNSPKMMHEGADAGENLSTSLKISTSDISSIMGTTEEEECDERAVSELRSELWEKERELTDIRLEALNSAHQLEQLRDAMDSMESTVENLKAENDHLKIGSQVHSLGCGPTSSTSQPSGLASFLGTSLRQPMSLTKSFSLQQEHYLGSVMIGERTEWAYLDSMIAKTFRLEEQSVDSLVFETLIPKPLMLHYISLLLKHRRLVFSGPSGTGKTYLAQRLAHYLLQRSQSDLPEADGESSLVGRGTAVSFNMHRQTQKELQLYLSNLANQIDRQSGSELPLVVIIDDISDGAAITELINGALTCKYHKPYIIGTTNQPVKMSSNNGLHLSFMVPFSNNVEPANGFLLRYLHRKVMEAYQKKEHDASQHEDLLCVLDWVPQLWYHLHTFLEKHSTSDFLIPCFFLSCPVSVAEFRKWFIDLWNHSIIPYLQEGAKDGIKVHGHKAVWEDPVEWVRGTLPWPSAQQDQSKLYHLPPPSTGPHNEEKKPPKDTPPPSSLEPDPLMIMLLKLQESANSIESP
uniref:Neuron navigator 1 n=1 Tax=Hippocampus comes TaxID=109280 RepID=A0A3Q2XBF2_HIPCM